MYEGVAFRDFPVVQATVILCGFMIIVVNFIIDVLYAVIDPRIRLERYQTMNGSRAASITLALPRRIASFRLEGFPWTPAFILCLLAFVALFANQLAPHDPEVGILGERFKPPVWQTGGVSQYLLGTDHLGRDVLSRLIFGARVSIVVGFTAVIIAGFIGTVLGIVSGYLGGWVDQIVMRLTDTWLALPTLTFAIFLAAILGPSMWNIVMILGLVYWTRYARVVRGEVLSLKERDYVRLAIVAGCSKMTIMKRHILPNIINTAIVLATLQLGVVIITEASLSFLGVGVPPPQPAWGLMLADGKKGMMAGYWWLTVLPGCCIMFVVLSANLLGDWLRVKLDPQLRQL
jgi:peptide/nickel transport system permease protein